MCVSACVCSFLRHVFLLTRFCDWVWGCGQQQRSGAASACLDFFRMCENVENCLCAPRRTQPQPSQVQLQLQAHNYAK